MYFLPHLYETENYQVTIELEEFDHATMHPADVCSDFRDFAECVMGELGWQTPENVKEALDLYTKLIKIIEETA